MHGRAVCEPIGSVFLWSKGPLLLLLLLPLLVLLLSFDPLFVCTT